MNTTKTSMLATIAILALGVGSSMAQEGAGGADVNSHPAFGWTAPVPSRVVPTTSQPQAGASDLDGTWDQVVPQPTLIGGDGNA
jgi:hypothetical protein